MKKIFFLVGLILSIGTAHSQQTLWEPIPLHFGPTPLYMYYDSVGQTSYISGSFLNVNDTSCNVVQVTDSGYILLPRCPVNYVANMISHDGLLYASGSNGMATWDGTVWNHVLDEEYSIGSFLPYQDGFLISGIFPVPGVPGGKKSIYYWNNGLQYGNYSNVESVFEGTDGNIRRMVNYKGKFYIAGNFSNLNDPSIIEIAAYDGTAWHNVGGMINSGGLNNIWDMLVWNDTLYVCGQFSEAGGDGGNSIAQWDGAHWHKMGAGLSQNAYPATSDLMIFNNELYAVGQFNVVNGRLVGGIAGSGFAKWTGTEWCTMGTEADGTILSLGLFKDELYLMGGFYSINGDNMKYIAKWVGGNYTDSCTAPLQPVSTRKVTAPKGSLSIYPNPSDGKFTIKLSSAKTPGTIHLEIFDIAGKKVLDDTSFIKDQSIDINLQAKGIYFVKVANQYGVATGKVIVQ